MFILVVLIFGLCWLPYHGYFIYIYYDTSIIYSKYTQHVYLSFYWFAMSNAMVNPLIYYWMNARFRQYFRTAMCGWRVLFYPKNSSDNQVPRNSQFSTKSGAGASIRVPVSPNLYHYALIAGTNGIPREQQRRLSSRTTRSTSIKKDHRKTTHL